MKPRAVFALIRPSAVMAGVLLLSACTSPDSTPPQVEIKSPAAGASLSGTVGVQVQASDESGIDKVVVYARGKGSTAQGKELGSSSIGSNGLYLASFAAGSLPNLAELELLAQAIDKTGKSATSAPVAVKTNNAGAPTLSYLVAYTLPPRPAGLGVQAVQSLLPASVVLDGVLAPDPSALRAPPSFAAKEAYPLHAGEAKSGGGIYPQAELTRTTALEWGWPPVPGADGYGVYLSQDVAGPYQLQVRQAASASGGQRYSRNFTASPGDKYYGVVTVLSSGGSQEGILSNADDSAFLRAQDSNTPADGQALTDGQPTLTWTSNPDAVGYLYYIFDKNPWDATAKILWTNFPQSTDKLSAAYPSSQPALPGGSYYWWVAAVSFNSQGQADGFSFSDPKKFTVP